MSKTVNVMPRVNTPWNISSPDYIIDNDKYDLKEINEGGKNTLDNAIAKSRKQATNFVFDITNAKLSEEETYSQIERIYESQFRKWVEKIIVIKNNEILKKFKR